MLSPQAESVVLLTALLGERGSDRPKPLTNGEWATFAQMLQGRAMKPADLLEPDRMEALGDWQHPKITTERLRRLLDRGPALAWCLERWERAGLWLLVRSDADYPRLLKRRLEWKCPPLLFGCGNRSLLAKPGLAVVGARDAAEDDLLFAASLGQQAAANGHSVVSGGAKGVDEAAMLASLKAEGTAVGVLAGGLQRAATSRKWRSALERGDMALISSFGPAAGFSPGNAMGRNRYIYCLASSAVVVASAHESGGTWAGAVENLKRGWVPLWVHRSAAAGPGNAALVARGAHWLSPDSTTVFNRRETTKARATTPTSAGSEQLSAPADHIAEERNWFRTPEPDRHSSDQPQLPV